MNSNETTNETVNERDTHGHWGHGRRWRGAKFLIPFFVLGAILLKGAAVMLLWNALIPDLFHGPVLHFAQAIGLMLLAKLLTGFGGGRHFGRHFGHHRHFGGKGRWMRMSPEEREKLREEFRNRFR